MDSLLILLPAAQETQLMPSCTTYRTQTNNASGSLWESHCHCMVWQWSSSIPVHTYIWFRSNQTKASLARLTDRLSLVKFIPPTPLLYSSTGMQLIELLWSWAVQWNFTMSPLLHILSASVLMCNVSRWFGSSKPGAAVQEYTVTALMSTLGVWLRVGAAAELYIKSQCLIAFDEREQDHIL